MVKYTMVKLNWEIKKNSEKVEYSGNQLPSVEKV